MMALQGDIGVMSRTRVKSLINAGAVLRDGTLLRDPSEPVRPGAVYLLQPPTPVSARPLPQSIPFTILHEDRDLIELDKPAGPGRASRPRQRGRDVGERAARPLRRQLAGHWGREAAGIVHRLDKDTSGIMVVAKTEPALTALSAMFAARDIDRRYIALAWGVPSPAAGEIEGAIGRDPRERKRMAVVAGGGKAALTHYATQKAWMPAASLLSSSWRAGARIKSACIWPISAILS